MIIIKLDTGKKIELTAAEFSELTDKVRRMSALREEVSNIKLDIGDYSKGIRTTGVDCGFNFGKVIGK